MASRTDSIHLSLLLHGDEVAVCSATPQAVEQAAARMVEEFRASSGALGMAMSEAEVRAACWPPLAARLSRMLSGGASPEEPRGGFVESALSFLVTLAYRHPRGGERYTVHIAADGKVRIARRPHRLLARNSVVLGNHKAGPVAASSRTAMALLLLLAIATPCLLAQPAAAESDGPYVHGETRSADQKLIVCLDKETALGVARAVNGALMGLREEILAASDDETRQAVYENKLYPSVGWQHLMGMIYEQRCSLVDEADHVSQRTVAMGPPELVAIAASHSVVESEMLYGAAQAPLIVWVVTTEPVPPVGP